MIYFDNASTSFPKAEGVSLSVKEFIDTACFNINRGGYKGAENAAELVFDTRELLADFFGSTTGKNVVFTAGLTLSLNIALKGLLKAGDTVLTGTMEHNAVMRPLTQLQKEGVKIDCFNCDTDGCADLEDFRKKILKRPKIAVVSHASNICGTILPLREMGKLCRDNDVIFVVDSAQTAGAVDIDVCRDNIDVLCFTAHKGLLSVQGVGGLIIGAQAAKIITPLISGGTGSFSSSVEVPDKLPDKLECGTLNLPGIAGLNTALKYIKRVGIDEIFKAELRLMRHFEQQITDMSGVKIVGGGSVNRCAITSVDFCLRDNGEIAMLLDEKFGIMTRSGLHCAPVAHQTIGSFPNGTVRFSFGHKNTLDEVDFAVKAIKSLV